MLFFEGGPHIIFIIRWHFRHHLRRCFFPSDGLRWQLPSSGFSSYRKLLINRSKCAAWLIRSGLYFTFIFSWPEVLFAKDRGCRCHISSCLQKNLCSPTQAHSGKRSLKSKKPNPAPNLNRKHFKPSFPNKYIQPFKIITHAGLLNTFPKHLTRVSLLF